MAGGYTTTCADGARADDGAPAAEHVEEPETSEAEDMDPDDEHEQRQEVMAVGVMGN